MRIQNSGSSLIMFTLILSCSSFPQGPRDEVEIEMMPEHVEPSSISTFKQEETETETEVEETPSTTPLGPSFGAQVAQIINGVATGSLDKILQGSFNLIPNMEAKQATNGAWLTIAGITTLPPTTATDAPTAPTTAEATKIETEATEAPATASEPTETEVTEETKTEGGGAAESTDAPEESPASSSTAPSTTNNEDDDDEEEGESQQSQGEGGDGGEEDENESEDLDTSVYSRSKVLRVA